MNDQDKADLFRYREALYTISRGCLVLDAHEAAKIAKTALNPEPQYEDVEVVRWAKFQSGEWMGSTAKEDNARGWAQRQPEIRDVMMLTGHYRREIKPKVRHRERVFGFEGHFAGGSTHKFDYRYEIYAEWG
jgi:hypothetical protein